MKHQRLPVLLLCQDIFKKTATHLVGHLAHHITLWLSSLLCKIRSWMDVCYSFDKPTCKWDLHACPGRDLSSPLLPLPSLRVEFRDQKEHSYTFSKMLVAVMRPHPSLGPGELDVSPEDSGCATIPAPLVPRDESRAWGWTRPTHTSSLWVTSTCQFCLPNMRAATSLLLLPPRPGSSHLPQPLGPDPPSSPHAVGHCLPWPPPSLACHPDTPAAPHWGLRDSPLPPRAPHAPPQLDTPLSTPRPCCSFHNGSASAAALAPQLS